MVRIAWLVGLLGMPGVYADVMPAPLFTDGAVLQRGKPVPVWGSAEVDEKVAVTFAGETVRTTTTRDGRWMVYLSALETSAEGRELVIAGKNIVTVRDVVVGEVWLCSGQSNMEFPVERARNAAQEISSARYPLIRHVEIADVVAETPAFAVKTDGWRSATPETVGAFTAVGFFFARDLHLKLGVPIGLINASWGSTPIEAWMSPAALASDPAFAVVHKRWNQMLADHPQKKAQHDTDLAAWQQAESAAIAGGAEKHSAFLTLNPKPRPPRTVGDRGTPAGLFNGMINPLLPYALRGVIWYQGESNVVRPREYRALFSAMITAWRAHFGQGEIPFYWVQLANFSGDDDWARLREAQTQTLALPNTGQAIAIDIGDAKNLHPANKQEVARRLALIARTGTYGLPGESSGPTFVSATREGAAIRVRFAHAGGGLVAHGKPVQSLEIAGADRKFFPATGKIELDTLVVSAREVKEPVAMRYAWSNAPEANLYNGAGLPAAPFRSDEW